MNDSIVVALRVLSCIRKQQTPARADIERLQSCVGQEDRCADADELACIVIRAEIQPRVRHANEDSATA